MGRKKTHPGEGSWDRRWWATLEDNQKIAHHLHKRYKISYLEWRRMFEEQNFSCKTCDTPVSMELGNSPSRGVVDHCHESGKVRGILCHNCNRALGLVKDNPETLQRMIEHIV